MPLPHELLALLGWQLLKALERPVKACALLGGQLAKHALVGASALTFRRRHRLPVGNPLADFFAPCRWQGDPVLCSLQHVRLPPWWQVIPLLLQWGQYLALGGIEAAPGAWRRWRTQHLAIRRWRRILRMERPRRGDQHGGEQQAEQSLQDSAHAQWLAGWWSLAASQP